MGVHKHLCLAHALIESVFRATDDLLLLNMMCPLTDAVLSTIQVSDVPLLTLSVLFQT